MIVQAYPGNHESTVLGRPAYATSGQQEEPGPAAEAAEEEAEAESAVVEQPRVRVVMVW